MYSEEFMSFLAAYQKEERKEKRKEEKKEEKPSFFIVFLKNLFNLA